MYEQLFDKPKMTEKLLSKPPFRYLHDIFLATIAATGFANGLYTEEEMDSKANHEKDAKIAILTKMITITEMVIGEKIDVKPSKIVAGLEPDRTNYFLQQLFRAATSGLDSTPYVRKIIGGGGDDEDDGAAEEEAARQ
jgi:TRAF3-interacting protein 1